MTSLNIKTWLLLACLSHFRKSARCAVSLAQALHDNQTSLQLPLFFPLHRPRCPTIHPVGAVSSTSLRDIADQANPDQLSSHSVPILPHLPTIESSVPLHQHIPILSPHRTVTQTSWMRQVTISSLHQPYPSEIENPVQPLQAGRDYPPADPPFRTKVQTHWGCPRLDPPL